LALVANNLNSVVQQEYTGDINIIADFSVLKPRQLLSVLKPAELAELILNGERATWPKVEAIRVTTKIGRLLDKILAKYEQVEMESARRAINKKEKKRKKQISNTN